MASEKDGEHFASVVFRASQGDRDALAAFSETSPSELATMLCELGSALLSSSGLGDRTKALVRFLREKALSDEHLVVLAEIARVNELEATSRNPLQALDGKPVDNPNRVLLDLQEAALIEKTAKRQVYKGSRETNLGPVMCGSKPSETLVWVECSAATLQCGGVVGHTFYRLTSRGESKLQEIFDG